jgi:NSS family neurotransmitter:Na+ symporter
MLPTKSAGGQGSMSTKRESIHGQWSSRWIFILAATGSAVGLGNIWKFPYIAGENGGGAFVLVYLLCIAAIGIPIMMAEVLLGRRGRQSPINTMKTLAKEEGRSKAWALLGWSGVVAGFLILSYYSVIAGWGLAYVLNAGSGAFTGAPAAEIQSIYTTLVASPGQLIFWHSLFMLMTMLVVARGVKKGLEVAIRFLMPALFVLLLIMVGYAISSGEFVRGLSFLFTPDFSKLSAKGVLIAMGHAFFTLSLGMGAIMIYGSYMPKNASIAKTSIIVALTDTVVALLAGMAIFPIVFANALEPGAGPGLIFQTLPIAFGSMPGGSFFGAVFFVLLVLAAWSSAISLIEPAVAWLVENKGWTRVKASAWCGFATWLVGLGTALSFNEWSDYTLWGKNFFELLDFLTSNIMLPLGGLFIALFAAWVMKSSSTANELALEEKSMAYTSWWFLVRFVTPVAVIIIFLNAIGVV